MAFREYYFQREPFTPALDVPMRGRESEWKAIRAFLSDSFQGDRVRAFLILGDYGYGKTFILNKIREKIEDPKSGIPNADKTLGTTVLFAETEPASSISYEYVTRVLLGIGELKLKEIAVTLAKSAQDKMQSFSRDFNAVIRGLVEGKREAFLWLTGETLSASERANLGVQSKFHPRSSLLVFMDFLKAMKFSGYNNLLVLIDEFEYAVNIYSERKLTSLFHTFKNIYDRFTAGGGVQQYAKHIQIIAATPRGWDVVTDLEATLRKRTGGGGISPWIDRMMFKRNQIILGPIANKAARQIIVDRIRKERMKHKVVPFETFPFIHPSFFDTIVEVSEGKPRYLLDFSGIVLEEAARKDLKEINGKNAREILETYGLI